ncbi:membrane protein [Bacillus coahuilensis m2-6]|uniref:DUF2975 domain-containing protein n=1 Tax=Bacillus coahuilensis TaxID=408580 RepID=UPI00018510FD|nr:DUF2975 domain-containing protein [Bacillus coahuilensis]KUP06674.1 membrane protein [Bacillus coahuilensis m2-6]
MRKGSTLFLRVVIFIIGAPILALCIWLPWLSQEVVEIHPEWANWQVLVLSGLYLTAIAYFTALYQALKLLSHIDQDLAFSHFAVKALRVIKLCAALIGLVYVLEFPFFYTWGEKDDAPGIILLGLVIVFASFVVSVFAAVLQKLLYEAIEIKTENDLTV